MAVLKLADLPAWARRVEKVTHACVSQAASDLLDSIEVGGGITRTGRRIPGQIPVDLGTLANSLQSTLHGSSSLTQGGQAGWVMIAGAMKAGDVAEFSWGGAAAPYARNVHDGAKGVQGTFWIDAAANRWPSVVKGAVAKVRAELE